MSTTKKGDELADKLLPYIGMTYDIRVTCARICRHAASLHRLNEDECNGHPAMGNPDIPVDRAYKMQERWERRVERDQEKALRNLDRLVGLLPDPTNPETGLCEGPWKLEAESDPRGCGTVIVGPEFVRGDSWGERSGICVP